MTWQRYNKNLRKTLLLVEFLPFSFLVGTFPHRFSVFPIAKVEKYINCGSFSCETTKNRLRFSTFYVKPAQSLLIFSNFAKEKL